MREILFRGKSSSGEWEYGEHPRVVDWDDILDEFEQRYGDNE